MGATRLHADARAGGVATPVGITYDITIGGKGFMLTRSGPNDVTPAWTRTGVPDTPSSRSSEDAKYGNISDVVDHPQVQDDWSNGAGYPYRDPAVPGTYEWAFNCDARWPNQLIHAVELNTILPNIAATNPSGAVDFLTVPSPSASSLLAGAGSVIALMTGTVDTTGANTSRVVSFAPTGLNTVASAFTTALEFSLPAVAVHAQPATFGSFTYIGNSSGSAFWRRGNNAEYTLAPAPMTGRFFLNAGSRLWRFFGQNSAANVANGADPFLSGNYSAIYPIGNGALTPDAASEIFTQVFVGLGDGLHAGDTSGTFSNVLAQLKDRINPENARDITGYNSGVAIPFGSSVWWFRPWEQALAADISIPPNTSQVRGQYRAVEGNGQWLYAGLYTGSQSHILAGRDTSGVGNGPYVWHHMHQLPHASKISRIFFDHITTPSGGGVANASVNTSIIPSKMWLATDASIPSAGTAAIYYAQVPRGYGNPLLDSVFTGNYMGSFRNDMGIDDWGAPGTYKAYRLLEVYADSLLSGVRYGDVYYSIDRGQRTYLGRAQSSPVTILPMPTATITASETNFNPTQLGWNRLTSNALVQQQAFASARLSGNLYTFGHAAGNVVFQPYAQMFSLQTQTWATLADMSGTPSAYGAAAEASNGRLYVFGGVRRNTGGGPTWFPYNGTNEYDPIGQAWATKTNVPNGTYLMGASYYPGNGRIYLFGGANQGFTPNALATVYEYNPAADAFAAMTAMPQARSGVAAVTDGSFIYVAGGYTGSQYTGRMDVFDPIQNTWATGSPMPTPIAFATGVRFDSGNRKFYVIGGGRTFDSGAISFPNPSTLVQEYDITATAWTQRTQTSMPHAMAGVAEASGQLYVLDAFQDRLGERTTATINNGFVTGQAIQLSLESYTVSQNVTPVYRSLVLRGALRPRAIGVIDAQIRASDNLQDRQGGIMRPGAQILQDLRDLAKTPTPALLIDLTGAESYVAVQQPIDEKAIWQEGQENPEIVAAVKLTVMDFSQNQG